MQGGYPRFVFHPFIKKLFGYCSDRFADSGEGLLILNSRSACHQCRAFLEQRARGLFRLLEFIITPEERSTEKIPVLYVILFPIELSKIAKEFWQHTGTGISSRFATFCLLRLHLLFPEMDEKTHLGRGYKDYTRNHNHQIQRQSRKEEVNTWVEERFGRNLPFEFVHEAKMTLRKRIAGVLGDASESAVLDLFASGPDRMCKGVDESHVRLFSCGMSAIYFSHQIVTLLKVNLPTVQFGFPYLDTLKIQQKFGSCIFFGNGNLQDLQKLKELLQHEKIAALFCEFPSNPLLMSPPLKELWDLANQYDFYLVVDETIGNFVNIHVLSCCDIIVSSLTKVFSGDSNVMGGSMVLNPNSNRYPALIEITNTLYRDCLWDQDALFLERNSRTFRHRIDKINKNAELLCDALLVHPLGIC
jgi:cystathionine gamma-synthase